MEQQAVRFATFDVASQFLPYSDIILSECGLYDDGFEEKVLCHWCAYEFTKIALGESSLSCLDDDPIFET